MSVIRAVDNEGLAPASPLPDVRDRESKDHGLVATAILLALRAYKIVLSPLFGGSCRFVPSCSDYAVEAVRTHGAAVGSWLTLKRLARCHPLCRAGYDPVPCNNGHESQEGQAARACAVRTR